MEIIDDELTLLHTRNYDTQVYKAGDLLRAIGVVRDTKPAGMYIEHDPDPLEIHQMQVTLDIELGAMTIVAAKVEFITHPGETCPSIVTHYEKLIGLNVARGFTRQVREMFGGPRGCTHTTALLQAMAPVIIQSLWSMRIVKQRESGEPMRRNAESIEMSIAANLNTCHVWDETGPHVEAVRSGEHRTPPLWITERMVSLGRNPDEWYE